MDGVDAWGPMAYADGMLVLRDAHTVKCLKSYDQVNKIINSKR